MTVRVRVSFRVMLRIVVGNMGRRTQSNGSGLGLGSDQSKCIGQGSEQGSVGVGVKAGVGVRVSLGLGLWDTGPGLDLSNLKWTQHVTPVQTPAGNPTPTLTG